MPIIPKSRQFDQRIMRLLLEQVLSTYLFLLMSFPHLEALLAFFMLILHEKGRKKRPSSPLFRGNNLITALS